MGLASNALGCHPGDPAISEPLLVGACGPARVLYLTLGTRGAIDPGDKPRDDNCGGLA
jgi:hypothetical protein